MSIIRAARHTNYYVLPTATIEDDRLSWEARGMLVYLLQKPDHWNADVTHLIGRTKACLGKAAGRDKVYSILKELRLAGYVYSQYRRVGGEFKGVDYEVSEVPDLEAAERYAAYLADKSAAPFTDLPDTAPPGPANPGALDKTERATKIEKAEKPISDPESVDLVQGSGEIVDLTLPADYPKEYPCAPGRPIFDAWRAYAIAFKARHKLWPVYNSTVAGQMGKAVARIQGAAPAAVAYYVSQEASPTIVAKLHPVGSFLKDCESYAAKSELAAKSKKRADKAAAALKQAEHALSVVQLENADTNPVPNRSGVGKAALDRLRGGRT